MPEEALRLNLEKSHQAESPQVDVETLASDALNKHPKKRRHAHHSSYHKQHPAVSLTEGRPKTRQSEATETDTPVEPVDDSEDSEIPTIYDAAIPPEEQENILAVESEEVPPETFAVPAVPPVETIQIQTFEQTPAEEEFAPVVETAPEVEKAESPVPEVGAPADLAGEKVYIEQIFTSSQGDVVYEVNKAIDNSLAYVKESELVLLDIEKERAALSEQQKEFWDENSGAVKAIYSFSHLGERWTDPRDITINRNITADMPFEAQEAQRMANRSEWIAGATVAFLAGALLASRIRRGEHLFNTGGINESIKVTSIPSVQRESESGNVSYYEQQPNVPIAVSANVLER